MRSLALLIAVMLAVPTVVLACKKTGVMTKEQCDALRAGADTSANALLEKNGACQKNEDCVEVPGPSCVPSCGGLAIAKPTASASAALAAIDQSTCKTWHAEGCATISPGATASCAPLAPACRDGKCMMRSKLDELSADQCSALLDQADKELLEAIQAFPRSCQEDNDCSIVTEGACLPTCKAHVVGSGGMESYRKAAGDFSTGICKRWLDGDCGKTTARPIPTCALPIATCLKPKIVKERAPKHGTCSLRPR